MAKILVTGGSGFIGSNLVEYLCSKNHEVVNFDVKKPRSLQHVNNWVEGNIINKSEIENCIKEFNPDYVIHLAARTDLHENKTLKGYSANIEGVQNLVDIINVNPNIKRTIYASSRMVCRIDYIPKSFDDFCPPNLYGESKMIGEKIVKTSANHDFVVVRPTSIWGPYFEVPYRNFFDSVKKGIFFMPKDHNPSKSFGFVYNSIFQIEKMLFAPKENLQQCYYLTDYPPIKLTTWADLVSKEMNTKKTAEIPFFVLKTVALIGDVFAKIGWKNVPLTSFRLNNLITNMVYDTTRLEELCGPLPYNLEQGVKITCDWMKSN